MTSPRGKLADVPLAIRRMCSLLYRATRRQAVTVDRLTVALDALAGGVDELRDHVDRLERQLEAVEDDVTQLFDRVDQLERRP